jgi:hypothetical protein
MRTTKEYENDIAKLLGIFFADRIGEKEIRIRRGLKYRSEKGYRCYSPMIDITVGPFSEKRGESLWEDYDNLVEFSNELINDLLQQFRANYQDFGRGFFEIHERTLPNDFRSFLSTSEDVNWNVSISGRIGIAIGYNDKTFNSFLRQLEYLAYTIEAKKLKFNSKNIVILKPDQFESILVKNIKKKRGDVRNDSKREEQ